MILVDTDREDGHEDGHEGGHGHGLTLAAASMATLFFESASLASFSASLACLFRSYEWNNQCVCVYIFFTNIVNVHFPYLYFPYHLNVNELHSISE